MNMRTLGSTGIKVSEVGFGSWQLGGVTWGSMEDGDAIKLVHRALDEGCNFFDTAPNYAGGRSETLLGKALHDRREKAVITTKFGHDDDSESDFSAARIRTSVEKSLKKLNCEYIDGLLLHNPPREVLEGVGGQFEAMEKLKEEGKIRSYGASVDYSEELLLLAKNSDSQIAELLFNAFHQEPKAAFPQVREKNIGLIIKVPLDSGWLTGKYTRDSVFTTGYRDRWSAEVKARRHEMVERFSFLQTARRSMAQGAIRFILGFDAVSTVIPGCKNEEQLLANLSASEGRLSASEMKEAEQLWAEHLKDDPLPW